MARLQAQLTVADGLWWDLCYQPFRIVLASLSTHC